MTPALALLVSLLLAQGSEVISPTPFDEVHVLELTADDPVLIDDRGPTAIVELEIGFSGTLHLWTSSQLDLHLRVEDTDDGSLLAEDDDSGGGDMPYVRFTVEEGAHLAVLVATSTADELGALELHVVAAPESDSTLAAVGAAGEGMDEARRVRGRGDMDALRNRIAELLSDLSSTPGGASSEALSEASWQLGFLALEAGDLATGRKAWEATRRHRERTLPDGHSDLLTTRMNLANVMAEQGDLGAARALEERVLAGFERTLPADSASVLAARQNLAVTMRDLGELEGARALEESVLAARERILPADHPETLRTRQNLAVTMKEQGDLAGARAFEEAVLAACERVHPADHRDVLLARGNLAITMKAQGDLAGARALEEAVLTVRERTLPPDHPDLLAARGNLAVTMHEQEDLVGARVLEESVLEACERSLSADHPQLVVARQNLASTLSAQGDLAGARALAESLLEALEQFLPADHPRFLQARMGLAVMLMEQGELQAASAIEEAVLAASERVFPPDHPVLLGFQLNLANTTWQLGDLPGAHAVVLSLVAGMHELVLGTLSLAPRQAREAVGGETHRLAGALFLTRGADPELQALVFELQETMRMVAGEAARALNAARDPGIRALLEDSRAIRAELGDLPSRSKDVDPAAFSARLTHLLQERDRLERAASVLLARSDVATRAIEIGPLARALGEHAALVAYRRIARWDRAGEAGPVEVGRDHLLAHVLAADGSLVRIDLGEASGLEELVLEWRRVLGRPLRGRGVALQEESGSPMGERRAGEALRARLLDPVLARLDERTDTLHVCADDLVFLVPLDSLPFEDGVLGDRYRFVNEVSCARLVSGAAPAPAAPGLLLVGGVDYDAGAEAPHPIVAGVDLRSGTAGFAPLPGTRAEADALRRCFETTFGAGAGFLAGEAATKGALAAGVPGKRWVHVATHGWFAPETIRSQLDSDPGERGWAPTGLEERIVGMAPMLLSGLAPAGANRGRDSLGRTPGLLTAEELSSLDLSSCDLAVLSACETNVGVSRAGQGIQSLQAALYAAGARSSITSLWKVDDAVTRRLFELFYTKLWEEKTPKAQALWEAKRVLRDEGAPGRDWAAWVLTGDPE